MTTHETNYKGQRTRTRSKRKTTNKGKWTRSNHKTNEHRTIILENKNKNTPRTNNIEQNNIKHQITYQQQRIIPITNLSPRAQNNGKS